MISTGLTERALASGTRFVCALVALATGGQIGGNSRVVGNPSLGINSGLTVTRPGQS